LAKTKQERRFDRMVRSNTPKCGNKCNKRRCRGRVLIMRLPKCEQSGGTHGLQCNRCGKPYLHLRPERKKKKGKTRRRTKRRRLLLNPAAPPIRIELN
jgi:hypothetical protein